MSVLTVRTWCLAGPQSAWHYACRADLLSTSWQSKSVGEAWRNERVQTEWLHLVPLEFCVRWPGLPSSLGRLDLPYSAPSEAEFLCSGGDGHTFLCPCSATTALSSAPGHNEEKRIFETRNSLGGCWQTSVIEKILVRTRSAVLPSIKRSEAFARFATALVNICNIRKGFARNSANWLLINRKVHAKFVRIGKDS